MQSREHDWDTILHFLEDAGSDGGGVLLVEGEQGTGKTHLLAEATESAAGMGFSLAAGTADEFGQLMPMAPLLTALDEIPDAAAGLDDADPYDRRQLAQRIRARIQRRASAGPMLLTLDDLHWADSATLQLLRILTEQLRSCPLLWVLARCGTEHGNDAGRLFTVLESEGATRIELGPLNVTAVTEIVTQLLGAAPAPELLTLAAGASGNPFLLVQLVTGLRDEGALDFSAAGVRPTNSRLPLRFHSVVRRRLDGLSLRTRHFLEIAAVLGRSFVPGDAAEMLGETPAAMWPCLQEALEAGVMMTTGDSITFRHDLVWRSTFETLPSPMRQALHHQAGEMLLEHGGSAVPAAAHLMEGARHGDTRALAGLDQAVTEVFPSSPRAAADLAIRALELTDHTDSRHFARTMSATRACTAAGYLELATALIRSAFEQRLPAAASAQLHCALSSILYVSGRPAEARDEAMAALTGPLPSTGFRDEAELAMLNAVAGSHDNEKAAELAESILGNHDRRGDAVVVAAMVVLSVIRWDEGRLSEALVLCREAVRRASSGSAEARRVHPRVTLATMLTDVRHFDEARATVRAATDEIDALGHIAWAGGPGVLGSRLDLAAGRLDDAVSQAQRGLELTESLGTHLFTSIADSVLGTVALRHGDLTAAEGFADQGGPYLAHYGATYLQARCLLVKAQVTEVRLGAPAAMEAVSGILDELPGHQGVLVGDPAVAPWLVRVALAADDPVRARTVVSTADGIALANPGFPAVVAAAAHASGLLHRDAQLLEQAMREHADPWARASAAEDFGGMLATGRDREQAVLYLEEAVSGYEEIDATRDAARVRRRLRRLGVRHRHWASVERPVSGLDSLTETERSVSELVAQGLTNQQTADQMFLSVHTVAFHLRQVFRKLGIGSRVDLTRMMLKQNGSPT